MAFAPGVRFGPYDVTSILGRLLTAFALVSTALVIDSARPTLDGAQAGAYQSANRSPYFGQPVPGLTPQLFAPDVVSTNAIELNSVFSSDLKEFFFTRLIDGTQTMFHSVLIDSAWSAPRELLLFPGGTRAVADDMMVSYDGRELYFLGVHPHQHAAGKPTADIWRSRKIDGRWSTAEVLPPPISTGASEVYPVVVADGSLYFSSNRAGGVGRSSVYRAQRLGDGRFAEPELVAGPINSEFGVGDPYVAPDERYIVFSSSRPPSSGSGDLFVSFRGSNGAWEEPVHLGDTINTNETEYCPMVTPDGKYLFFSRRQGPSFSQATAGDVYWVDATILHQVRRQRK